MRTTEVPVSARDARDIAEALRVAVWSLRRFGERQVGLPPLPHSEFEVIRTVSDTSGVTVSEVARALGLQPSNVSTTVRRLVEQGLIDRVPDDRDRRSIRLHLTEKARGHKKMIDAAWVNAVRDRLSEMTTEEARLLADAAPLIRRLAGMG